MRRRLMAGVLPAIAAATTATTIAAASAATAARSAILAGTGFIDGQGASADLLAGEGLNGGLGAFFRIPMVTKAKPRERPLVRSVMRLTSETGPWVANRSCRSFSVVSKERFPTYNFVLILI